MRDAAEKAGTFLKDEVSASKHLEAVRKIIHGFETPYGLELLATVHWVAENKPEIQDDIQRIVEEVHSWNERKKKIFKEKHIEKAWEHLNEIV
ncbi:hypothetical protein [Virgibacillus ainsalahensis]